MLLCFSIVLLEGSNRCEGQHVLTCSARTVAGIELLVARVWGMCPPPPSSIPPPHILKHLASLPPLLFMPHLRFGVQHRCSHTVDPPSQHALSPHKALPTCSRPPLSRKPRPPLTPPLPPPHNTTSTGTAVSGSVVLGVPRCTIGKVVVEKRGTIHNATMVTDSSRRGCNVAIPSLSSRGQYNTLRPEYCQLGMQT